MAGTKRRADDLSDGERAHKRSDTRYETVKPMTRSDTQSRKEGVSNAVLLTTELLENILHHLPMKDLLLAQRMSRKWQGVIGQSKRLQQQLFFTPKESGSCWEFEAGDDEDESETAVQRGFRKITTAEHIERVKQGDPWVYELGELNTLLFRSDNFRLDERVEDGGYESFVSPWCMPVWDKHASWRRMLITQPPAGRVNTDFDFEPAFYYCEQVSGGRTGVTAGDLFRVVKKAAEAGCEWDFRRHSITSTGLLFASPAELEEWSDA
ncbi:hypothetical protein LTR15_010557 [Elasticomyces elasticus]|nr:hypothetical protein LTR15_010557 [Elasticomyces elasticus]